MKKINLAFLLTLFCSTLIIAQSEYWQTSYTTVTGGNRINSTLFEKDHTFISVGGSFLYEDTYYVELRDFISLPLEGSAFTSHYFYAAEVANNGDPFFFAAERTGTSASKMYLNTFTKSELLDGALEIPDVFEEEQSKGPAAVQINDGEIRLFGNQSFHKITLSGDGTINLDWSKPANFGLIADAKVYTDGYILCNEDGKLIYVDEESEMIWVEDLGAVLRAVLVLNDGFLLAAQIDEESALIKTDFNGNSQWEKKYGEGFAVDLDFSNDGGIVFTGENEDFGAYVIKTDMEGEIIWQEYYKEHSKGSKILKSKYGGYLLQTKGQVSTDIFRIAEDGSTGELTTSIPPKSIEANNIRTSASARGQLFWDGDDVNTHFPKDSATSTIFAGGLWFSGIDQGGNLHTAFTNYTQTDFSPGPFNADPQDWESWDQVWRVNKQLINKLQEDWLDGTIDGAYPIDLWTYPGVGNPNFNLFGGQAVVPNNTAPFIDVNNDGVYNILDGDYPQMKGDDMIWWIMSNKIAGTNLGGEPLEIEVRGTLYAYGCDGNSVLYNTAFLDFDITNFSANEYSDVHIGTFIDFDIGCYLDDYIGTLIESNAVFGYNDSPLDGEPDCLNYPSFEPEKIPLQSVIYLNTDMSYSMHWNNVFFNEPGTGPPNNSLELHNFLQGIWTDGSPQTEGGNGYGGTVPIDYAFPGNPFNSNEWHMCAEDLGINDRRMVMVTGPHSLFPNQIMHLDLGMLTHENIDYACPDISQVENEIAILQNLYNNGGLDYNLYLGPDLDFVEGEVITLDAGSGAITYSWSTGETTPTIEVSSPGIYSVTITTAADCAYVDEVNVGGVVSLNEIQTKAPKVYPNPASSHIFVELTDDDIPQFITLENTLGQPIKSYPITLGAQHSTIELNVGNLAQGMYLLRFHYAESGKVLLRKVMIAE